MKEKIQKKCRLSTLKILCFNKWKAFQVIVFDSSQCDDTRQNELTMKKNNNITMNVDELNTHWTVRFADSKEKNMITDKLILLLLKIKNVQLTNILCCVAEKNST